MGDMLNPENRGPFGKDIHEPDQSWRDDGGARIEVVTDPNWLINGKARVIRRVGWRQCMTNKKHRFFSESIDQVRRCPACKNVKTDETFK